MILAIVPVIAPKLGETICDPACGSAGFLCEAKALLHQAFAEEL